MKKYAFGVDIGGTTCKIGFFDTNGTLLDKWEIKTNTENNGESILSDVAKAVDNKLAQEAISKDDVQGIGIGVPGPVDSQGVVHRCVNLGWGVVNVAEELGNLTGLTIKVGNDANVAALGEMWQGGAKGSKDVIMVTLGTGILAAAGSGKRDLADRSVSQPLEKVMESRKPYLSEGDPEHVLLPCEGSLRPLLCAWPIIAAGDVTGAVGLLAEDRTQQPDPAQQKAVAVAAAFLAKQMEE